MSSDFPGYLIVHYKGDMDKPVHIYEGDTLRFTLKDVPVTDSEVEFDIRVIGPSTLVIDHSIIVKSPAIPVTGLEPRLSSEGVRKVVKSDRG